MKRSRIVLALAFVALMATTQSVRTSDNYTFDSDFVIDGSDVVCSATVWVETQGDFEINFSVWGPNGQLDGYHSIPPTRRYEWSYDFRVAVPSTAPGTTYSCSVSAVNHKPGADPYFLGGDDPSVTY